MSDFSHGFRKQWKKRMVRRKHWIESDRAPSKSYRRKVISKKLNKGCIQCKAKIRNECAMMSSRSGVMTSSIWKSDRAPRITYRRPQGFELIQHIIRDIATLLDPTDPTQYWEKIFYVVTSSWKSGKREKISESERAPSKTYRRK